MHNQKGWFSQMFLFKMESDSYKKVEVSSCVVRMLTNLIFLRTYNKSSHALYTYNVPKGRYSIHTGTRRDRLAWNVNARLEFSRSHYSVHHYKLSQFRTRMCCFAYIQMRKYKRKHRWWVRYIFNKRGTFWTYLNLKGVCLIFLSAIYQLFIKYFNIK